MAQVILRTMDLAGNPQNGIISNNGGYCCWWVDLVQLMGDSFNDSDLFKIQFVSGINPLGYTANIFATMYLTDLPFYNGTWVPNKFTNKTPITHTQFMTGYSATSSEINFGQKRMDGAIIHKQETIKLGIQFWNETTNSQVSFSSQQNTSYLFLIEPYHLQVEAPISLKIPMSAPLRLRTNVSSANASNAFITKSNYGIESVFNVDLAMAIGSEMFEKYNKFRIELVSVDSWNSATSNGYTITVFGMPFCLQNSAGNVATDNVRIALAHYKKYAGYYAQNAYLGCGINQMRIVPFYIHKQAMLRFGISMVNSTTGGSGVSGNQDVGMDYLFNIYGEK